MLPLDKQLIQPFPLDLFNLLPSLTRLTTFSGLNLGGGRLGDMVMLSSDWLTHNNANF